MNCIKTNLPILCLIKKRYFVLSVLIFASFFYPIKSIELSSKTWPNPRNEILSLILS
jgi:hypothetical protein